MSGKALILPPFYVGGKLGSQSLNNVHDRVSKRQNQNLNNGSSNSQSMLF